MKLGNFIHTHDSVTQYIYLLVLKFQLNEIFEPQHTIAVRTYFDTELEISYLAACINEIPSFATLGNTQFYGFEQCLAMHFIGGPVSRTDMIEDIVHVNVFFLR